MNQEQVLLNKWRLLSAEKQQEVIYFVDFLEFRSHQSSVKGLTKTSELGKNLRKIREEIIADGLPLLNVEEVEKEKAERRGGYQGNKE